MYNYVNNLLIDRLTNPATICVTISWMNPEKLPKDVGPTRGVKHTLHDGIHIAIECWI